MKKRDFRCLGILLTPVLAFIVGLCCAGTLHAAEASVEYRGRAEQIVFLPEGDDLFLNFKGLMPGDRREQVIQLANRSDQTVSVDLKALSPDPADQAFLNWFNLRVLRGDEVISDAAAGETGGLEQPVRLAVLRPGETAELTAELAMDSAADGSVQGWKPASAGSLRQRKRRRRRPRHRQQLRPLHRRQRRQQRRRLRLKQCRRPQRRCRERADQVIPARRRSA